MSARNYILSAREQSNKIVDCLPQIKQQKFGYRISRELPALSANASRFINRNITSSYKIPQYIADELERAGTPYSDFFSESETGTSDFRSEESDSSSGSALNRNTAEATKALAAEWERIERTLYDEDGDKSNRPQIIEECKQWKQLHPQLRIIGKAIPLPDKKYMYRQSDHEEVIAMHYSDYEQFSESEERLSQSSSDVTPQNSPRFLFSEEIDEPRFLRERIPFYKHDDELGLPNDFCSLLQITPIQIRSPLQRNRHNPSILRSDIASSKWMRSHRPESSTHFERNSAKSFVSLDTRNTKLVNGTDKMIKGRVMTARQRDIAKLEPLHTPPYSETNRFHDGNPLNYSLRKVSLPPLLLDEEKKKVNGSSAKKLIKHRKSTSKSYLDRMKHV